MGGMSIVWASRLGVYLYSRIKKMKKDDRFDELRKDWKKLAVFWGFQAITVFIL